MLSVGPVRDAGARNFFGSHMNFSRILIGNVSTMQEIGVLVQGAGPMSKALRKSGLQNFPVSVEAPMLSYREQLIALAHVFVIAIYGTLRWLCRRAYTNPLQYVQEACELYMQVMKADPNLTFLCFCAV
eukprot:1161518-Pelagomonas_calceolata.AAC.6